MPCEQVVPGAAGATSTYRVLVAHPLPTPLDVAALNATPGVLSPSFSPGTTNYTLSLPNSSVSVVTFEARPMADCPDGLGSTKVSFTADGRQIAGGEGDSAISLVLDADNVMVTATSSYIWHADRGHTTYYFNVTRPGGPPGPAPTRPYCYPQSKIKQFCPDGKPCPQCGHYRCVCPQLEQNLI